MYKVQSPGYDLKYLTKLGMVIHTYNPAGESAG